MSGLFRHPPQPQQRQAKLVQEPAAGNTISSASLTFGFSEFAAVTETFTASGGVAFGFSEAAVLTERLTLAGGAAFSFSEAAALSTPVSVSAGNGPRVRVSPYATPKRRSQFYADLSFGFGVRARLAETDDELALVLGAF